MHKGRSEVTEEMVEQGKRAIKAFQKMIPQLNAYARAVSGNNKLAIKVGNPGTPPRTSGDSIYYFPPARLGLDIRHVRSLCDRRDVDLLQLCPACNVREEVICSIYHEIAHVCYGSFDQPSVEDVRSVMHSALVCIKPSSADKLKERFFTASEYTKKSFIGLSTLISNFFPILLNALEDARIEDRLFAEKPGTRIMFAADTALTFTRGIPNPDGSYSMWAERSRDAQIIIGSYCKALGYNYNEWLSDEVVESLHDEELGELLERVTSCKRVAEVYELALYVLARMRELGYLLEDEEQRDEEQKDDEESSDCTGSADGRGGEDNVGDGDSSSSSIEKTGAERINDVKSIVDILLGHEESQDTEALDLGQVEEEFTEISVNVEDGGSESSLRVIPKVMTESDKDSLKEQLENSLVIAFSQFDIFEATSVNVEGLRDFYYPRDKGSPGWSRSSDTGDISPQESLLGSALLATRRAFSDNKRSTHQRNIKSGRVDARALGKRAAVGDPRLFKKKSTPGKKDYCVVIMVDISGSTSGKNIILLRRAVAAQAELLHRTGVRFAIFAHTSDYGRSGYGTTSMSIYHIKDLNEPWNADTFTRLKEITSASGNLDGHALEYARRVADQSTATDKVILYYSDGAMPCENYAEELETLQREIATCRSRGYALLGVGVRTDSPNAHGLNTVRIDSLDDISKVVKHIEGALVGR